MSRPCLTTHADLRPACLPAGNLIRTPDGRLAVLDFGLMTEVSDDIKYGMIEAISHLIHRDYEAIVEDFVTLDFIPEGTDLKPILPVLAKVRPGCSLLPCWRGVLLACCAAGVVCCWPAALPCAGSSRCHCHAAAPSPPATLGFAFLPLPDSSRPPSQLSPSPFFLFLPPPGV